MYSLKCSKSKSVNHLRCLTKLFPIYQNKPWTILRWEDGSVIRQSIIPLYYTVVPEPGGPGGHWPPKIFGRQLNPIPTMGGRFCPFFTSGTPNVFHLPASLIILKIDGFLLPVVCFAEVIETGLWAN